jgi:intein/homing endonuclease
MVSSKISLNNPEIAEILGAFIGDGWIEKRGNALYITGSPTEDKEYYDLFLAPLFTTHFVDVKPKPFPYWGVYGIATYKKATINKAMSLGFQTGRKSLNARIPKEITNSSNEETIKAVLRGIFDTDGSFWCEKSRVKTSTEWKRKHNYHPEFRITSCSRNLLEQAQLLLQGLGIGSKVVQKAKKGFKNGRNINNSYALNIRKISEIEKWFTIVGTNNPRHQTRYQVWKKLGHLPPFTTIAERKAILAN